jgi:hypothetical protein
MTMIDVDTSPLQAAREWRGINLVAAAMTSGLPMSQAEALEEGDASAFASIDEMIAAAIVYGSSLGIGRDEAVALLDRTVSRTGVQVQLPDPVEAPTPARPSLGFSEAVQARSALIANREAVTTTPITPAPTSAPAHTPSWVDDTDGHVMPGGVSIDELHAPAMAAVLDPVAPQAELPMVPEGPVLERGGPTPEQAVAASGEIHIDEFGPEAPWERSGFTSELEAWAEDVDGDVAIDRPRRTAGLGTRMIGGTHAALERIVGTERADAAADWMTTTSERMGELTRDWRERMRQSEHATLLLAIGGGAVLIALVVALGGAIGGDETKGPGPADREAVQAASQTPAADATTTTAKKPAKLGPPLTPDKITLDVFNAGSQKGYAKDVAAKLEGYGYKIDAVTNSKSDYSSATIIHPKDMAREAKVLARRTGIHTLQVAPGSTRKITIIVM